MITPENEPLIVICAADDNFAIGLAVTVRSMLEHLRADRKVELYIIDGGIKQHNKDRILRSINSKPCNVNWLQLSENTFDMSKLPILKHLKIFTYYRLFVPDLLPKHIKKAIYLDTDLIVLHDLSELWDLDMLGYPLLAARCQTIPTVSHQWGVQQYNELGLAEDTTYFNAGILAMDLTTWRDEQLGLKVLEYSAQNQQYILNGDQDGLNAILANRWLEIDPHWNWPSYKYSETDDPYIIHMLGGKPWNSMEINPAKHLFYKYVDMTAWSGYRFSLWRRLLRRIKREASHLKVSWLSNSMA